MPKTATAIAFEDFERKKDERIIESRIRHFIEMYQPQDDEKSYRFYGDLMMLVREIYRDASSHSNQVMETLARNMPPVSFTLPK